MNTYEAKSIFLMLERAGKEGSGILSLSQKTHIKPSRLRRYLSTYSEFFTQVDSDLKYRLNTSNHFHGSTQDMLKALKSESRIDRIKQTFELYNVWPILTSALVLLAILNSSWGIF